MLTLSPSPSGSRGSHAQPRVPRGHRSSGGSGCIAGLPAALPSAQLQRGSQGCTASIGVNPLPALPRLPPHRALCPAPLGPTKGSSLGHPRPGHGEGAGCPRTHRSSDPTPSRATSMPARPRAAPVTALNEEQRARLLLRPCLPPCLPAPAPSPAAGQPRRAPRLPAAPGMQPQVPGSALGKGCFLGSALCFAWEGNGKGFVQSVRGMHATRWRVTADIVTGEANLICGLPALEQINRLSVSASDFRACE